MFPSDCFSEALHQRHARPFPVEILVRLMRGLGAQEPSRWLLGQRRHVPDDYLSVLRGHPDVMAVQTVPVMHGRAVAHIDQQLRECLRRTRRAVIRSHAVPPEAGG